MNKNLFYRTIPKVDVFLETKEMTELSDHYGKDIVTQVVREETALLRKFIADCDDEQTIKEQIESLPDIVRGHLEKIYTPNIRKVINATGTILHTNLGRAPISRSYAQFLSDVVTGYCNLEYNLEKGARGERYSHFEKLLCEITGAEAAMAVNNNASAVMLILSSMARGGEVIVSRGELVEIGGKFRIPDVMELSGATLVEVGTTNKTHLSDYENALTDNTKALLKVHTSNYRIVGFSELVPASDMKKIAQERDIPVIEDLGSGVLVDLSKYGCEYEPTVQDSIKEGVDVVCFSGDKLLGGPQAGIIIGKKKYIDQMKKNQLTRAVRIDKFTAAALELTLMQYLSPDKITENIPVLRMISETYDSVADRACKLKEILEGKCSKAVFSVKDCESQIGGGSLPLERIKSTAVLINPSEITVEKLEIRMRELKVPIIPRLIENSIWLDVRTVDSEDFELIAQELAQLIG